jgi:hypothetical protein
VIVLLVVKNIVDLTAILIPLIKKIQLNHRMYILLVHLYERLFDAKLIIDSNVETRWC